MTKNWKTFQRDVLDTLTQYNGFFTFTERVGSLSDHSRPDFIAKINRKNKKEIWIVDAKNKSTVDDEDIKRMEKYCEQTKADPIDIGLDLAEIPDYEFRKIFITNGNKETDNNYEYVDFQELHQFLQKELIYTDQDKVVRDLSKMIKRNQLKQNQVKILSRTLKPFIKKEESIINSIKELRNNYVGLKIDERPFSNYNEKIQADLIIEHTSRPEVFLIDIPYSKIPEEKIKQKKQQIKQLIDLENKNIYYSCIKTFKEDVKSAIYVEEKDLEKEIRRITGTLPHDYVADLFQPKIQTQKEYLDGKLRVTDKHQLGFKQEIKTKDDIKYEITTKTQRDIVQRFKDNQINSRKKLGKTNGNKITINFKVTTENKINYKEQIESIESFKQTINSIYHSAINPKLTRKIKV